MPLVDPSIVEQPYDATREILDGASVKDTATRYGIDRRDLLVGDTVQIFIDGTLLRTRRSRHDTAKEFGALAQPNGKPRRVRL